MGDDNPVAVLHIILGPYATIEPASVTDPVNRAIESAYRIGAELSSNLVVDEQGLADLFFNTDRHVWTPHSLGIVKERNFWEMEPDVVRAVKFRERNSHEEFVCSRTAHFCSTSPEIWRGLVAYHGSEPEDVFDFPPCIDGKLFKPRPMDELDSVYQYLSEKSAVPAETLKSAKIIFETSRMDHTKRKDGLLQSFAKVAGETDNVYCFIGGGPDKSPVFQKLAKLKKTLPSLEGRGFLLGFIPEEVLEPLFSAADIFVSASEMEGFGMSASQGAAAGAALICSDLIPFATQYAPDATVIVPAGDVDAFAGAMTRLLNDESERQERAKKLQQIAGELDWVRTAKRFVEWFHDRLEE